MTLTYQPLSPAWVKSVRQGGADANGQPAERAVSDGAGNPCRHCLHDIPAGEEMLILAARPFPDPQPYAELGPIFLCAKDCAPYADAALPPVLNGRNACLMKAYRADNRIYYGTGRIIPPESVPAEAAALFEDDAVAYIDIRSATNNCFTFRITRDGEQPPDIT